MHVLSLAKACHLPERSTVPFDAIQIESSSANIHMTVLGSVGSHFPLLGSHYLRFGPGYSEDEVYLHTLSSAKWGD